MSEHATKYLSDETFSHHDSMSVNDILSGNQCDDTIFYVPHSKEIILSDRPKPEDIAKKVD